MIGSHHQTERIVAALREAATELGDPRVMGSIAALEEQSTRAQVRVLIVGAAGSGRVTLINGLLGIPDLLPSSAIPKAPVSVSLVYRPHRTVQLRTPEGRRSVSPAELRGHLLDHRLGEWCDGVEVGVPCEQLSMVDLEVEALEAGHSAADWKRLLAHSDFLLIILNASALLSQAERDFLREHVVTHGFHRVALIITHLDQVMGEERGTILAAVSSFLGPYESQPALIEVAAPEFSRNPDHPLRTLLTDLEADSLNIREASLLNAADAVLKEMSAIATRELALASLQIDEVERARAVLANRQGWLRERVRRVQQRVDALMGTVAREQLHDEIRGFGEVVQRALPAEIESVSDLRDVRRYLPGYLQTIWQAFLERRTLESRTLLEDEADRIEAMINDDLQEILDEVEGALGTATGDFAAEARLRVFIMPRRGESHAGGVVRGLGLHAFAMLIIASMFGFGLVPALLTLAGSHVIRRLYTRDIEGADRTATIEAALAAGRDLEREIHTQIDERFARLLADTRTAVQDQYLEAVRRIEETLSQDVARSEDAAARRDRLTHLLDRTLPALRDELEPGARAEVV